MSRSTLTVATLALILAAGALILQFVLPSEGGVDQQTVDRLNERISTLEQQPSTPSLRIAYIQAEEAFKVFTDAVQDLRQKAQDKQAEIASLQQEYVAGTISQEDYQGRTYQLQVELLKAQLSIDMGTIDKMLQSDIFSDIRTDLTNLKDEAQPILDEMNNLMETVRVGVVNPQEFEQRFSQVQQAFNQLDQLLTQAATSKIVETANKIALKNGYDLVIRSKNVVIYRNSEKIVDITDSVKSELAGSL